MNNYNILYTHEHGQLYSITLDTNITTKNIKKIKKIDQINYKITTRTRTDGH